MEVVKQFMSRSWISAEFQTCMELTLTNSHLRAMQLLGQCRRGLGTAGDTRGQDSQPSNPKLLIQQRSCLLMVTEKTPPANSQPNSSALCPCWISHWHLQTIPAPLPCNFNGTVTCTFVCPGQLLCPWLWHSWFGLLAPELAGEPRSSGSKSGSRAAPHWQSKSCISHSVKLHFQCGQHWEIPKNN